MNARRSRHLRRLARAMNGGNRRSELTRIEHRPRPVLDLFGRLVGQVECWTDRWEGYRRTYQYLKRSTRTLRQQQTPKIEKNQEKKR